MLKKLVLLLGVLFPLSATALIVYPFLFTGEVVPVSASTSSATGQFTLASSISATAVLACNTAASPATVKCGGSSVTAGSPASGTDSGFLVPANYCAEGYKGNAAYCAVRLTTGTGTVYLQAGTDSGN